MNTKYLLAGVLAYSVSINACFAHLAEPEELRTHVVPLTTIKNPDGQTHSVQIVSREEAQKECNDIADQAHNVDAIFFKLEISRADNHDAQLWEQLVARTIACCKIYVATDDESLVYKMHDATIDLLKFLMKNARADHGINSIFDLSFNDDEVVENEKLIALLQKTPSKISGVPVCKTQKN